MKLPILLMVIIDQLLLIMLENLEEMKQLLKMEKYLAKKKELLMAFVDLEKAFDRVSRKVVWWALKKVGVEE